MDVFHDETRQRVPEMLKNNSRFHIQGVTQIEIRLFPYTHKIVQSVTIHILLPGDSREKKRNRPRSCHKTSEHRARRH